jgi:hypothetical protein
MKAVTNFQIGSLYKYFDWQVTQENISIDYILTTLTYVQTRFFVRFADGSRIVPNTYFPCIKKPE